jgi:hypothetical protein
LILDDGPLSLLLSEQRCGINFHRWGAFAARLYLFAGDDTDVFQALLQGEFNISGFQTKEPFYSISRIRN